MYRLANTEEAKVFTEPDEESSEEDESETEEQRGIY